MPGVHRQSDLTCGHGCWPPQIPESWSPDVFVNGLPVVRNGDKRVVHCCPPPCHGATYIGVNTVFANGACIQRIGHPLDCDDTVCKGSGDTFVP